MRFVLNREFALPRLRKLGCRDFLARRCSQFSHVFSHSAIRDGSACEPHRRLCPSRQPCSAFWTVQEHLASYICLSADSRNPLGDHWVISSHIPWMNWRDNPRRAIVFVPNAIDRLAVHQRITVEEDFGRRLRNDRICSILRDFRRTFVQYKCIAAGIDDRAVISTTSRRSHFNSRPNPSQSGEYR